MHFPNQVLAFFTIFLFASAGVQARCSIEGPGTAGFNNYQCVGRRKVRCPLADDGGASIRCCDDSTCT
ncbi:hypothetical protein CSOJ01_15839 [Colletotrichum sojae]|uniref:Uncharacterized protein n=1 Tax=Colletotrichum sojae TaxID=2175907 RepID=A0A8H6IM27_9PEZI|nr:hypothetical protein CSOJ01_15839 [Colletotrichum sojae]